MDKNKLRKLVLEDGEEYLGAGFGAGEERVCELVFNTSMAGYQEILSDPSYADQAVVMTYPLIGNYGMAEADYESERPALGALIVRELCEMPSNFRCAGTLEETMLRFGIPGIQGVDTRKLTRSIRDKGSRLVLLTDARTPREACMQRLRESVWRTDAVARVSTPAVREFPAEGEALFHVAVLDCGVKRNILRSLNRLGCAVTLFPWDTPAEAILASRPHGLLISNGPGDPENVLPAIETLRALRGKLPTFGICLGHQLLALAYGAGTYKLKFGHRGGNHPVRDLETGRIGMTSQNHSFAVDEASLRGTGLIPTHINLLDGTVEGMRGGSEPVFSVQFHPESAPGPRDEGELFSRFLSLMEEARHA